MAPPRKPKIGLQRPEPKPAGKPKEKPKTTEERNKTTPTSTIQDLKNRIQEHREISKPDTLITTEKDEEWRTVPTATRHSLRSDTQRKDVQRIMPQLESIINKNKKANMTKIEQWQITKFRDLKEKMETTEPAQSKVKDIYFQMRTIARNIGYGTLFDHKKTPTPKKTPNSKRITKETQLTQNSLNDEFEENQDEDEDAFDMDSSSIEEQEETMPELHYDDEKEEESNEQDDSEDGDNSTPGLALRQSENNSTGSIDLLADKQDFDDDATEDTEGAKFIIKFEQTQKSLNELQDDRTDMLMLTQTEAEDKKTGQENEETTNEETEKADETSTKRIENQMKKAEQLLDKEVQEIEDINLHTPKVHRYDPYEEYDFETLAEQAIQNRLNERSTEMETEWKEKRTVTENKWNQKRQAIERQARESLEEQAGI